MKPQKFNKQREYAKRFIYVSKDTLTKAKALMPKYKASLSNITRAITLATFKAINREEKLLNYLGAIYLDEAEKKATYIKPKFEVELYDNGNKLTHFMSNALYMYVTNHYELLTAEQVQQVKKEINRDLQKTREVWWDLNNQVRSQKRAISILNRSKKQ